MATNSPPTRCDEGDQDVVVGAVTVPAASRDRIKLNLALCKAAFRILVFLDGDKKIDRAPVNDAFEYSLPSLSSGDHDLQWSYLAAGNDWQIKSEVSIDGATCFLERKANVAAVADQQTLLTLRVQ